MRMAAMWEMLSGATVLNGSEQPRFWVRVNCRRRLRGRHSFPKTAICWNMFAMAT